ncbi:hypothetical protein EON64_18635, partial [archaeon]
PTPIPEDEIYMCKICFANNITACFPQCGHCVCKGCASAICGKRGGSLRCPFCNASVSSKIDLYMP